MTSHLRFAALTVGIALCLCAQSRETFKARLSALPADAKTRAELAGSGSASAVLTGSRLAISGSFQGLRGAATSAQLHTSPVPGVRGPALADLTISKAAAGTIAGSIDLTPGQLTSLHKGGLYIQIQSEKAPEGVLWGWLLR